MRAGSRRTRHTTEREHRQVTRETLGRAEHDGGGERLNHTADPDRLESRSAVVRHQRVGHDLAGRDVVQRGPPAEFEVDVGRQPDRERPAGRPRGRGGRPRVERSGGRHLLPRQQFDPGDETARGPHGRRRRQRRRRLPGVGRPGDRNGSESGETAVPRRRSILFLRSRRPSNRTVSTLVWTVSAARTWVGADSNRADVASLVRWARIRVAISTAQAPRYARRVAPSENGSGGIRTLVGRARFAARDLPSSKPPFPLSVPRTPR